MPTKRNALKERNLNVKATTNVNETTVRNVSIAERKMCQIFDCSQRNESFHKKYITEMELLYKTMNHEHFFEPFLMCVRVLLNSDEENTYATTGLKFSCEFITSLNRPCANADEDADDTHPLLVDVFKYLLTTTSAKTKIRFRICQLVNLLLDSLGAEAVLDDDICDDIFNYMSESLQDAVASVRIQAVRALQRLQVPDDADDVIIKLYKFHMANDPSSKVRIVVLSAIARHPSTLSAIMERLWDVDNSVRRHCLLQMASYPVQGLSIEQRLTFIECGLNDRAEEVKKVAVNVLLPQWLQFYQKNYLSFISALKLDEDDESIERFVRLAKQSLLQMFPKVKSVDELIAVLELAEETNREIGRFERCVPLRVLSIEKALYWLALIEYLQKSDRIESDEKLMEVICDLTYFCDYLQMFCNKLNEMSNEMDFWALLEQKHIFRILVEILLTFDLGDEVGRKTLEHSITTLLTTQKLDEPVIQQVMKCTETLKPNTEQRLDYIVKIIETIIRPEQVEIDFSDAQINFLIDRIADQHEKIRLMQLKLVILELREKIISADGGKYVDELAASNKEFLDILIRNVDAEEEDADILQRLEKAAEQHEISDETIIKCLRICFYSVASKRTVGLTQSMCQLYKDFVRKEMNSPVINVRNWALKCGISISMLYEHAAVETFDELSTQFFQNQNTAIWVTVISGVCELISLYGLRYFETDSQMENLEMENGNGNAEGLRRNAENSKNDVDPEKNSIINLLQHILDSCNDLTIKKSLIIGFGRLVISGYYTADMISRLLLEFFDTNTDPQINQILSVFFETLVRRRQQVCLQKALFRTLFVILDAAELKYKATPDTIIKFIVNATMPASCQPNTFIHDNLAKEFLSVMLEKLDNKELLMLLSKEILALQISKRPNIDVELFATVDDLLTKIKDPKIVKNLKMFKNNVMSDASLQSVTAAQSQATNDVSNENDQTGLSVSAEKENTRASLFDGDNEVEPCLIADADGRSDADVSNNSNETEVRDIELDPNEIMVEVPRVVKPLRKSLNPRSPAVMSPEKKRGKSTVAQTEKASKRPAAKAAAAQKVASNSVGPGSRRVTTRNTSSSSTTTKKSLKF